MVHLVEEEHVPPAVDGERRRADGVEVPTALETDLRRAVTPAREGDALAGSTAASEAMRSELDLNRVDERPGHVWTRRASGGNDDGPRGVRCLEHGEVLEAAAGRGQSVGHGRGELPSAVTVSRLECELRERADPDTAG